MNADPRLAVHKRLVETIGQILAGNPSKVQSAVLAELLAILLGGCPADLREKVLANHLDAVRDLIPHVEVNKTETH